MSPPFHLSQPGAGGPRLRVLVVDSPATAGLEGHTALTAIGELTRLPDVSALARHLEVAPGAVVVCAWVESLARWLEKTPAAPRVIHYGPTLPASVLESIGHGFDVAHADSVERLVALLSPHRPKRSGTRARIADVRVTAVGLDGAHPLVDVSNDGLAFEIGADADREPPLPGTVLGDAELSRDGAVVLTTPAAVVTHVSITTRGTYRIGCHLAPASRGRTAPTRRIVRGTAETAGLLARALKTTGIVVRGIDDEVVLHGATATIDAERGDITLAGVNPSLRPHVVARGRFELGGSLYRFSSPVLSDVPLRIKLPSELEETRHRDLARYRPSSETPVTVEITTPFADRPLRRPIVDVSSTGLSLAFDPEHDILPVGLRLTSIVITLGGEAFRCRGVVRSVARTLPGGKARCGVELEGLTDTEQAHLAERIVRLQFPGLEDGAHAPFDELLGFFRRAGYLGAERERAMEPVMPAVRRTFAALSGRRNRLLRSLVYRDGEQIIGHISSVRAYRRTFMVQHLAAAAGRLTGHAGLFLSVGNAEYLMHDPTFDYLKIWFHSQNKFPSRVFGGFARKVRDPDQCVLEAFAHTTLSTAVGDADGASAPPDLEVREASVAERAIVEQHFVRTRAPLVVRSDDLLRSALTLDDLDSSYRELGLERRRVVLLAVRRGAPLGFALVELSSPGLNLFEALSRFSLHLLPAAGGAEDAVRRALLAEVRAFYRRAGRAQASALIPTHEAPAYEALGLAIDPEQSMCLTTRRTQLRRFAEHMEGMTIPRRPKRAGPRAVEPAADDDVA